MTLEGFPFLYRLLTFLGDPTKKKEKKNKKNKEKVVWYRKQEEANHFTLLFSSFSLLVELSHRRFRIQNMGDERKPKTSTVWPTVKPFVNGGASGMLATCVIQPIDMIKVSFFFFLEFASFLFYPLQGLTGNGFLSWLSDLVFLLSV